jgi:hypothetical protein
LPFPYFSGWFFIALPFFPFFFTFVLSLFFGTCVFHLYPTSTCLGLKDLLVVVVCTRHFALYQCFFGLLIKSSTHFRLLIVCLLDNKRVFQIVTEFTHSIKYDDDVVSPDRMAFISRVAQLLASVPDKVKLGGSPALAAPYPFSPSRSSIINFF